jgi:prepilin-type N-terminal cleavage/methylation domain-containing protein/prepilin-type processing-associated H-X9-DG protein
MVDMKDRTSVYNDRRKRGFTLIELLVVIAIIGILAGLIMPAMAKAKGKGHRVSCLNNLKQLSISWFSYSQDHDGMLPETYFFHPNGGVNTNAWVRGSVDDMRDVFQQVEPGVLDSTNVMSLKLGTLWPYNTSAGIYRCPSDRSMTVGTPRIRSYSINSWMGGYPLPGQDTYRVFRRETDIIAPPPSKAMVFVDEHEKSINEGWFVVDMLGRAMFDVPANRHDGTFTLSFADGHVEAWKFQDQTSKQWSYLPVPANRDSERLRWSASSLR